MLPYQKKIQSLTRLKKNLKNKKGLVFTNGCFDILHRGHVEYLAKAKTKGKLLIVAVNSDESVRNLKGPSRPINSLKDRMEVIASLECVDYVTWFSDETPLRLIRNLKPQTLVKGGDWRPDQIIGGAEVLSWGGKVFSLPFIEGKSTTSLIDKIRG